MPILLRAAVRGQAAVMRAAEAGGGPLPWAWNPEPQLPTSVLPPLEQLFAWGRGVIVVIAVIGVLYCAGKIVVGRLGRSDVAVEGVGGLLWTIMGILLMIIAVTVVMALIPGSGSETDTDTDTGDDVFVASV